MGILSLWARWRGRRMKPGEITRVSGQYTYSQLPHSQITSVKGNPLPPPPGRRKGGWWELTDVTRHHGG